MSSGIPDRARRIVAHALLGLVMTAGLLWVLPARAEDPNDILIVANKSVKASGVPLDEIQEYFLKIRQRWPDGEKVVPIHAKENKPARNEFVKRVMKMSPAKELAYWSDQKIRHGQHPPVEFSNTLKAVFKLRNSIGYVLRRDYKDGVVKILAVIPR